jgi:hypothetical protein
MIMALFNTILGTTLSFAIGMRVVHLTAPQIILSVVASQVGGLIGLLVTLRAEKNPTIRKHILNRSLKTWTLLFAVYSGFLLLISPALRDLRAFAWMVVPLMISNGLCIIAFGPIQDRLVRDEQKRALREAGRQT